MEGSELSTFVCTILQSDMQFILDAFHSPQRVFTVTKGGETEVAFAAGAKAGTRGAHDVDFGQKFVEEIPGRHVVRCFEPDIGGVDATVGFDTSRLQAFADDTGVFHVVGNGFFDLFWPSSV